MGKKFILMISTKIKDMGRMHQKGKDYGQKTEYFIKTANTYGTLLELWL
jgi:hypothetical protein